MRSESNAQLSAIRSILQGLNPEEVVESLTLFEHGVAEVITTDEQFPIEDLEDILQKAEAFLARSKGTVFNSLTQEGE